jgi:Na+-translocating ferredoxin:NAD+ oxidoreductase RnfG subunit
MRRYLLIGMGLLALGALRPALGVVLLTNDQALKAVFPDADKYVTESWALTDAQLKAVKGQLGDKWTLYQSGGVKSASEDESAAIAFQFASKAGKKTGVAVVEVQPGKWGPVKYIIAMDLTGKVTGVAVMSYVEQRGKPIATKRFLSQFNGKTVKSPITVGKDIDAVSGATISSRASAFAVKKVIALYNAVYEAPATGGE